MGLAERRSAENFKTSHFQNWEKQIHTAASFNVPVEVMWDKLAKEGYASSYEEFFTKIYFQPTIEAFKSIARDQMGKDALKTALKKVVITNTGDYHSGRHFTFNNGVLTIDHDPATNVDDIKERTDYITSLLENSL